MPRAPRLTCPQCAAPLQLLAAVFESLVRNVGSILKSKTPLSRVFFCKACKHLVWVDRSGKRSVKTMPPARAKARKSSRKLKG